MIAREILKKIWIHIIIISLFASMGNFSYATEIPHVVDDIQAEATAELVENVVGIVDVNEVVESENEYVSDKDDVKTSIPKDPDEFVTMEGEEIVDFGMSLPEETSAEKGVSTDDGTVVYQTDENVDICIQSITDKQESMTFCGIREILTIKNAYAPKEYTFNIDLPDDYEIITSEEYYNRMKKNGKVENIVYDVEPGCVYVIDNDNRIQSVFEPAWARDAKGNEIETFYSIEGNALIQTVKFDKDSVFPIVADPESHPNKVVTKKLSQSQVEDIIDKCDSSENTIIFCSIVGAGAAIPKVAKVLKKVPYASGTYLYFTIGKAAVDVYLAKKKKTYKKYLKKMEKENKKLEEKTIYKYGRSNNRRGYYVYQITCRVV